MLWYSGLATYLSGQGLLWRHRCPYIERPFIFASYVSRTGKVLLDVIMTGGYNTYNNVVMVGESGFFCIARRRHSASTIMETLKDYTVGTSHWRGASCLYRQQETWLDGLIIVGDSGQVAISTSYTIRVDYRRWFPQRRSTTCLSPLPDCWNLQTGTVS